MIVYCNNQVLADNVIIADTFWGRLKGLMGRKSLAAGEGLLLTRCSAIHCFFMRMTIDAVYLSAQMTVLGKETIPPWKIGKHFNKTANVLELAAGSANVAIGDKLEFYDNR